MSAVGRIGPWLFAALAAAALARPAAAQDLGSVFGPQTLHGLADLELGAADGERSWLDAGFGKTPLSGAADGGWRSRARLTQALVEWKPQFSFAASAVVSVQWQDRVHPGLDIDEAYLKLRAPPLGEGRLSGRVGLFYPPVSLEHTGPGWTTQDLLSASALNSWIGEEVKVGGAEVTYSRRFGGHEIAATGAVFGWNDTSGTLLSFRGWAAGSVRTGASTDYELPPLSAFIGSKQGDETYPLREIDGRVGYYGRLEWRPPAPIVLEALFYDNRGDKISVESPLQWAWATRFLDLGLSWSPDEATRIRAQALSGVTLMGFETPETWVDVRYRAGYVLASRDLARGTASGRLDWFEVRDRTFRVIDNNDETGWAATGGWRQTLTPHADLLFEAQHVDSKRPSRALAGQGPRQKQNIVRSALRLRF